MDAELLAFHYDVTRRTCSARTLGAPEGKQRSWHYLTRFHSLVVKEQSITYGVDLATGERGSCKRASPGGASRVQQACAQADLPQLQRPFIGNDSSGGWRNDVCHDAL